MTPIAEKIRQEGEKKERLIEMKTAQVIEVYIEKVSPNGEGIGRLDDKWVTVRGAVPGQHVSAQIIRKRKGQIFARLLAVLKQAPQTITPRCAHFGQPPDGQGRGCGGCTWQQLDYSQQLMLKHQMLEQLIQPLHALYPALPPLNAVLPSPQVWGYRNKIEFSFSDKTFMPTEQYQAIRQQGGPMPTGFYLGFHAPQAFASVIDIQRCHLISPAAAQLYQTMRRFFSEWDYQPYSPYHHQGFWRQLMIREGFYTGQLMLYFCTTSSESPDWNKLLRTLNQSDLAGRELTAVLQTTFEGVSQTMGTGAPTVLQGQAFIEERLFDLHFRISPQAFFQTNTQAAEVLYQQVLALLVGVGNGAIYDLYSGTGTIAQVLAAHGWGPVYAIEEVASAVADARVNAAHNRLDRCHFKEGKVEHLLPQLIQEISAAAVVVDPPRAGLPPCVIELLRRQNPKNIIYVSCNPVALVRDLHRLLADGMYGICAWQPVDLFPHTPHVETVVKLVRG